MDYIDKMKRIEYINRYLRDFTENQSNTIDKLSAKIADEVFEELCEEYEVCYVCGKNLVPNVRLMVREPYPSTMYRKIFTKGCPDTSCEYNKRLVAKYEN